MFVKKLFLNNLNKKNMFNNETNHKKITQFIKSIVNTDVCVDVRPPKLTSHPGG